MTDAVERNLAYYDQSLVGRDDYWRFMAAPRFRVRTLLAELSRTGAASVVDLGCGNGLLLDEVARRFPAMERAGVDLSPALVEGNRRRRPDASWHTLDLDRPGAVAEPLAGRFAAVVAAEVIEHVERPEVFLRNAADLAAPGGWLLLSTQSGPVRPTERHVGHVRHFSRQELRRLLDDAGWRPERVWNCGFPFHDLSKWWANRRPETTLDRFGSRPYGRSERAVCAALRLAFRLNSRRRGVQLFAVAQREGR